MGTKKFRLQMFDYYYLHALSHEVCFFSMTGSYAGLLKYFECQLDYASI